MKLFRQKDELFEVMAARTAGRRGAVGAGGAPAAPSLTAAPLAAAPTPTTVPLPRPQTSLTPTLTAAPPPPPPPPAPPPKVAVAPVARPTGVAARPAPSLKPSSAVGLGRPAAKASLSTTTRRNHLVPGGEAGDDLLEVDGDALVVVDDGWEEAAPPGPERTLAIRADTAIVGGLLAGGLLVTAFLMGRTSSAPEAPAERPITPVVIAAAAEPGPAPAAAAPQGPTGATTLPAGAPARGSEATAAPAGFQAEAPAERPAASPGKFEVRVCTTTPEKAQALSKWLNEAPRSPIFGRGDLQVLVNGGSVKIQGFMQREADVLSRVRATSDPTGGSGTFHDAYFAPVR